MATFAALRGIAPRCLLALVVLAAAIPAGAGAHAPRAGAGLYDEAAAGLHDEAAAGVHDEAAAGRWATPDFYIAADAELSARAHLWAALTPAHLWAATTRAQQWAAPACAAQLAAVTCVARDAAPAVLGGSRDCADDAAAAELAAALGARLARVLPRLPPALQALACALDRLVLEGDMAPIAYAGVERGTLELGLRRELATAAGPSLGALLTQKEQAAVAGWRPHLPDPAWPVLSAAAPEPEAEARLLYVLAHELAHLLDFTQGFNVRCLPGGRCPGRAGSFTALSWQDTLRPWPAADFPLRAAVCFYGCPAGAGVVRAAVPQLYAGLAGSPFVTLYGATSPLEDFAEVAAVLVWAADPARTLVVDTRQGAAYDLVGRLDHAAVALKRDYVAAALRGQALQ